MYNWHEYVLKCVITSHNLLSESGKKHQFDCFFFVVPKYKNGIFVGDWFCWLLWTQLESWLSSKVPQSEVQPKTPNIFQSADANTVIIRMHEIITEKKIQAVNETPKKTKTMHKLRRWMAVPIQMQMPLFDSIWTSTRSSRKTSVQMNVFRQEHHQ